MPSLLRTFARRIPSTLPTRTIPAHRPFTMTSTTYSSSTESSSSSTTTSNSDPTPPKAPLALPEAPHTSTSTTPLDMSNGSTSIKLDHLGPMVVNVDGTLSRISNWDKMAEIEKENTLRIIGKRNRVRLESLRAKEAGK